MARNRPRSRAVDVTKSLLVPTGVADYIAVQVAPSQMVQVTEDELSPTQGSMNAAALRREGKLGAFVKLCTNWRNGSCHNHAACSYGHVLRYFNTGSPEASNEGKAGVENTNLITNPISNGVTSNAAMYSLHNNNNSSNLGEELMMPGNVHANRTEMHRTDNTQSYNNNTSSNGLSWLQRLVPAGPEQNGLTVRGQSVETAPSAPYAVCRTPRSAERHAVPSQKSVSELERRSVATDSFFSGNASLSNHIYNHTGTSRSHSRYLGITPMTSRTTEEEMRSATGGEENASQSRAEAGMTSAPSFTVYGPSISARTNSSSTTTTTTTNTNTNSRMNSGQFYGGHHGQRSQMNGVVNGMTGHERTRNTRRMSDVYVDWNSPGGQATCGTTMSPTMTTTMTTAAQSAWWGTAGAMASMNQGYPTSQPSRRYTAPTSSNNNTVEIPCAARSLRSGVMNGIPQPVPHSAHKSREVAPVAERQKSGAQGTLEEWTAWLNASNARRRSGAADTLACGKVAEQIPSTTRYIDKVDGVDVPKQGSSSSSSGAVAPRAEVRKGCSDGDATASVKGEQQQEQEQSRVPSKASLQQLVKLLTQGN